eukprot:TRINITY_DN514_c0_g2_i1.p1 TRINITY_DN514_c0_g2~~TRINITY_DN514_c0_g2_i1.p1  ORF type:complete len:379 (-),score=21.34 TRINITY_DN514_c0_g2_i1:624-1760(-)
MRVSQPALLFAVFTLAAAAPLADPVVTCQPGQVSPVSAIEEEAPSSKSPGADSNGSVRMLTFGARPTKALCDMLLSAGAYGHELTVMGWYETYRGVMSKIVALQKYLKEVGGDQIVLFHDGHDVLYQADAPGVLARFLEIQAEENGTLSHPHIVFGAEKNCWPGDMPACADEVSIALKAPVRMQDPPLSPEDAATLPMFLNSGTFIGYAWHLKTLVESLAAEMTSFNQNRSEWAVGYHPDHDQAVATGLYVAGNMSIVLDFRMRLFMNLYAALNDTTRGESSFGVGEPASLLPEGQLKGGGVVYAELEHRPVHCHKVTGTTPALLHFSAKTTKRMFRHAARQAWWMNPKLLNRSSVAFRTVAGKRIAWTDYCTRFYED